MRSCEILQTWLYYVHENADEHLSIYYDYDY